MAVDAGLLGIVLLAGRPPAPGHRSGLTGTITEPASTRRSASIPWRVSSTTRTSAGSPLRPRPARPARRWRPGRAPPGPRRTRRRRAAVGHQVKLLGPVDPYSKGIAPSRRRMKRPETRHRADGPVLVDTAPLLASGLRGATGGRRLTSVQFGPRGTSAASVPRQGPS